ncbi:MAG: YwiC-like family protein [Acidobacteriota bacterium]|nr:MAG: YwiC-like family protein [Acidobacteriota bacterium]
MNRFRLWRRHIALPADHGSWVFLLSPLIIGLAGGGRLSIVTVYLVVASLAGFLARQPLTIAIKALSGRRSREELPVALLWTAVYGGIAAAHVAGLVVRGFGYVLLLAIPGAIVFAWYLLLVSRRTERRQLGLELAATGALALSAPAAYWIGRGAPLPFGWLLWLLVWAQSAASIVYVYLRLVQREWKSVPPPAKRWRAGGAALTFSAMNFVAVLALALGQIVSFWLTAPFLIQTAETVWGTLHPCAGWKPRAIGLRQLAVSALFTVLFVAGWYAGV